MTAEVRIFLIDDHRMTRASMRSLLGAVDGFEVVGDHGDPREAIDMVARARPDATGAPVP